MSAVAEATIRFDIDEFLAQEAQKDMLRFSTAGSVDDGKSTLIGRLLCDSQNVYEDQMRSVVKASASRSAGPIDFSLLTDGLRAEREQGITIDVAYRYFSTARRKFIIADTPGHEQYTRNMATGASTADLAIILTDARKGLLPQSRRHAYIASLLGIRRFVVAVNKMDLVGYEQGVFEAIRGAFLDWVAPLGIEQRVYFLPISALEGDNVVERSANMPWFDGPALLEHLESVDVEAEAAGAPFRYPVQRVLLGSGNDFRGYAGQVASGSVRPGDTVFALPSGRSTTIRSISTFDGDLAEAHAPMSVTLTLEHELDLSRGEMLAGAGELPHAGRDIEAHVVWMNETPLSSSRRYLLKHTTQVVSAEVAAVRSRIDVNSLGTLPARTLSLNDIGVVEIRTKKPVFFDAYSRSRGTGSFILVDPDSNATVAAGMIVAPVHAHGRPATGLVTAEERAERYGHTGAIVRVGGREALAENLERRLFEQGCAVALLRYPGEQVVRAFEAAGLIAIVLDDSNAGLPADDQAAADAVWARLFQSGSRV